MTLSINEQVADNLIANVSDTAFWVAHFRALETARPDALFRDPLAGVLAGERGKAIAESMPMRFMSAWAMAVRTRIIDAYIEAAVGQGVDTVLNLGAGLDTRPYRLKLPESLLWVEADYAATIDFKEQRLAAEKPRCRLERVKIDLGDAAARHAMLAAVNARAKRLLVVSEGVTPYLTEEQVGSLADDLRKLGGVRAWIVDYISPHAAKHRLRLGVRRRLRNAPHRFTPADWFGFFEKHGWRVEEMHYYAEEGQRLGRPIEWPLLLKVAVKLLTPFVSRKRRAEFRQGAGVAVLEPKTGVSGGRE